MANAECGQSDSRFGFRLIGQALEDIATPIVAGPQRVTSIELRDFESWLKLEARSLAEMRLSGALTAHLHDKQIDMLTNSSVVQEAALVSFVFLVVGFSQLVQDCERKSLAALNYQLKN
jgi:hypothetical protein